MLLVLQRKFLQELLLYFFFALWILLLTFTLGNFLQLIHKGLSFVRLFRLLPYLLPYTLPYVLPLSLMIAITLVIGRMNTDGETLVLRSSGIHLNFLTKPLVFLSFFLLLISYHFQSNVIPFAHQKLKLAVRNSLKAHFLENSGKEANFRIGQTSLYCDFYSRGYFEGVQVLTKRGGKWVQILSPRAYSSLVNDWLQLTFFDVLIRELDDPYKVITAKQCSFVFNVHLGLWRKSTFQTTQELWQNYYLYQWYRRTTDKNNKKSLEFLNKRLHIYASVLYERYAMSVACISFSVVALGISLWIPFRNRLAPLFFSLLLISLTYFGPLFLARFLGKSGRLAPEIAFIFPNFFTLLAGFFLLRKGYRK